MTAKVLSVRKIESAEGIPDGVYRGKWSGYTVLFETSFGLYEAKTETGIRGLNVDCDVTCNDGMLSVEVRKEQA